MNSRPFKLTITLATPMIMTRNRLTLDGLLSAAIFRKTGLKGDDCIPHIPLEIDSTIFKASSLFIDASSRLKYTKVGRNMSLKGLNDLTTRHFLPNSATGTRYLSVDQSRGPYKTNMSEYSGLEASAVCFFGVGNAQSTQELIETYIIGLGVHSNSGAGQILHVEHELLDDDDMSCWITSSGKPARPLPSDLWLTLDNIDSQIVKSAASVAVRFPYWEQANKTNAVFPTEYTHF